LRRDLTMHQWLESLLGNYGYVGVGLIVALESMGLPLPGETVLLAAAAYAGAGGPLNIVGVIGSAAAGAILGDTAGYWLGRLTGLPLLERYGWYVWLSRRRIDRARAFFERHGAKTVFLGRFVTFLRIFAAFLAGVGKMPYGRSFTYNVLGGAWRWS
jgi:membrane protein DedA with SNARE-associated domain